jgi:hypothetical protein
VIQRLETEVDNSLANQCTRLQEMRDEQRHKNGVEQLDE